MAAKLFFVLLSSSVIAVFGQEFQQVRSGNCGKDTLVVFGAGYEDDGVSAPDDLVGLHKYSTGKVWPRYLADQMNMRLQNDAVAGATSGVDNLYFKGWSGNKWQVDQYLKIKRQVSKNVLIGVGSGAVNEMFADVFTDQVLNGMVSNITDGLKILINAGATSIFVLNIPDYTMAPAFQPGSTFENTTPARIQAIKAGIINHNQKMARALADLARQYPKVQLIPIDFHKYWVAAVRSKPYQSTYGITNGDGLQIFGDVYAKGTSQPDDMLKYAFYDAYHPASGVHLDVATNIKAQLRAYGITPYYYKK